MDLRVDQGRSGGTTPSERLATVKVGLLHINPTSKRGRRIYMIQMLVLVFIPHLALVLQNCTVMASLSSAVIISMNLHDDTNELLSVGDTVWALQEARTAAVYLLYLDADPALFENAFSDINQRLLNLMAVEDIDIKLEDVYVSSKKILNHKAHRLESRTALLEVYRTQNEKLLYFLAEKIKDASTLWGKLTACFEIIQGSEDLTSSMVFAAEYLTFGALTKPQFAAFAFHDLSKWSHVEAASRHVPSVDNLINSTLFNRVDAYHRTLLDNSSRTANHSSLMKYFKEVQGCMAVLDKSRAIIWESTREMLNSEMWRTRRMLLVGIIILTVVVTVSPILFLLVRHTVKTIQTFTKCLEESTHQVMVEKQKSDQLLSRMLPRQVLRQLRAQRTVPAEAFDCVTIFFSDIVGFTNISATSTPMEVIRMLNILYRLFDGKIAQHDVYKVETIGDAYMVVSGLPQRNGKKHALEIADMSLSLMRSLQDAKVPHRSNEPLMVRAGVNSGPCVAGVVGATMPRYCLFGDTVNTASRMESTGEAMKIHISLCTKELLDELGGYEVESRGIMDVQGKGKMETFWLTGKTGTFDQEIEEEIDLCQEITYDFLDTLI